MNTNREIDLQLAAMLDEIEAETLRKATAMLYTVEHFENVEYLEAA